MIIWNENIVEYIDSKPSASDTTTNKISSKYFHLIHGIYANMATTPRIIPRQTDRQGIKIQLQRFSQQLQTYNIHNSNQVSSSAVIILAHRK